MTQSELPLYPKLSSIYNKIMQLAIAVVLILVLINVLIFSQQENEENIEQHFKGIGQQYSQQIAISVASLLENKNNKQIETYIEQLVKSPEIYEVFVYSNSGQLLFESKDANPIKDLYGVSKSYFNSSAAFVPFVQELREDLQGKETTDNELLGYVRLTLDKNSLVKPLFVANNDTSEIYRILLCLAVAVGFLLTRGLNRFSRQGFRLDKKRTTS